ncbi:MAG: hypothetical protein GC155_07660 [Alphaproteobacteria bacterium]|nr:hypothetical protein [Alphaproteobacteria bacterium]
MKAELPLHSLVAAISVCLVCLIPLSGHAQTPPLRPDQVRAIDLLVKDVDPAARDMARAQLAKTLAPFSEAQIAMMLAQKGANDKAEAARPAAAPAAEPYGPATPEDIAYNRAQANPVIRKSWAAQKAFDDFVDAKIAAFCPPPHSVAHYGSAWRFEFRDLQPSWVRASDSADLNVEIFDQSYVKSDGRYQYDFSKVRYTFDKAKVGAAIEQACREHTAQGKAFLAAIDPFIARGDLDGAYKAEQRAIAGADGPETRLSALFKEQNPGGEELALAFLDAKRIR